MCIKIRNHELYIKTLCQKFSHVVMELDREKTYPVPLCFIFKRLIETFLEAFDVEGLKTVSSELKDKLNLYLKLFIILYADDTVIMEESAADLQKQLDSFSDYCDIWRLKVNVEKSKIVVFSQGKTPNNLKFNFNGKQLKIVDEFN